MVIGDERLKVYRRHQSRLNLIGALHKVKTSGLIIKNLAIPQISAFFRTLLMDAGAQLRLIWPDKGLNYQATEVRAGATEDLRAELDGLFDRFVTSQAPDRRPRARREDADVWKEVTHRLPADLALKLQPTKVEAGPFSFKFEHTYQNGSLHVVEPLSFDLLETDSVREKSLRWLGYAQHLKPYLSTLRLVVAGPDSDDVAKAYRSALGILSKATEVYEADQTDRLSHDLQKLMS